MCLEGLFCGLSCAASSAEMSESEQVLLGRLRTWGVAFNACARTTEPVMKWSLSLRSMAWRCWPSRSAPPALAKRHSEKTGLFPGP